jgi:hypothetical protein
VDRTSGLLQRGLAHASSLAPVVEGVTAFLAALVVCVFLTWPLSLELGDHIFGLGGDSTGTIAAFRLWAHEIGYHVTGVSHIDTFGAPFGYEEGNGVNVQSAFVFFPAYLVTELAGEIVAYNFLVFYTLALSGLAMYWLVRRLGCGRLAAGWAGLVFIVFPWHLEKVQGHISLAQLAGFPLLVLAAIAWFTKPDLLRALFVAGAAAVLWTTSGYFGFMALVAVPALFGTAAVFHAREVGIGRALRRVSVPVAACLAVPAAAYAIASTGTTEAGIAQARGEQELLLYGARPWEFLVPSYRNPQFGDDVDQWLGAHLHGSNFSETSLFVGWLTIVLAAGWLLWALVRRSRLRRETRFATVALVGTIATGLVFSLPSPLPRTDIETPVHLIWQVAPQFRVPARFVALVMTGIVPLAALALDQLGRSASRRIQPRALARVAPVGLALVASILSFVELSIAPPVTLSDLGKTPPEYAPTRKAPPGLLAEYPLAPAGQAINSDYLFWQRVHGRRIVNGARAGTFADSVTQTLVDPTTPATAESLATLGVSVIVVRPSVYAFAGGGRPAPNALGPGYRRLAKIATGSTVWQVTAEAAPAIAAFGANFHVVESLTPRSTMRWMGDAGRIELYAPKAGTHIATFAMASYARPRRVRIEGAGASRVVDVPGNFKTISLPISLPRGRSSLLLTTDPSAEALPDGRLATVYMTNWGFDLAGAGKSERVEGGPLRATPAQ